MKIMYLIFVHVCKQHFQWVDIETLILLINKFVWMVKGISLFIIFHGLCIDKMLSCYEDPHIQLSFKERLQN